jgi:acyl-CoA reductase-like NAD-dependent aldehyde dehydrogenase
VELTPDPLEVESFTGSELIPAVDRVVRVNPARISEMVGSAGCISGDGVDSVVAGAHRAFGSWRRLSIEERSELLLAAADDVASTADDLGPLLARELGKMVDDCKGEMGFAAAYLRSSVASAADVLAPAEIDDDLGRLTVTQDPFGVIAAIVPWNAPLILSILKVAPALATGNTIVVKPSPLAPLAVTCALQTIAAGLPDGVLSVVHGDAEVGSALVTHPLVRKVAFTGGDVVGRIVARSAAEQLTPTVMELGGNDAAIFLDDAEFTDDAMERAVFGTFLTSGQVCMAAKRLYVPAGREAEFVDAYRAAADRVLHLGDPLDAEATVGPVASAPQRDGLERLLAESSERGGAVHDLGDVLPSCDLAAGWWVRPSLVTGLDDDARLVRDEQFGPIVPLLTYDTVDEAVARANDTELGLASSVWSADEDRAFTVGAQLEAGMTFINCHNRAGMSLRAPFGGVKGSGYGREFGREGVAEYVQPHSIHLPGPVRAGGGGRQYPT